MPSSVMNAGSASWKEYANAGQSFRRALNSAMSAEGRYSKYYFLNNRLAGVIMIGDLSDMVKTTEALEKHALYKDVLG